MEGRRFLIILSDEKERIHVKEICEAMGCSVICVDSPYEARKYVSSLSKYHRVIIDVDPPNDEAIALCGKIKRISPETFIVVLRSPENQNKISDCYCDAMLLKPLYSCTLSMVLNNNQM